MTAKRTRGQKAAKTLGSEHMAKIGAKGGKNSPGNFKKGGTIARAAGQRSGQKRLMNKLLREIANLEADRVMEPDQDKASEITGQVAEKVKEYNLLKAKYEGKHAVDADSIALEYEQ